MAFISTPCAEHWRSNLELVQDVPFFRHSHVHRPWKPMWTCFLDHTTSEHPTPILNTCTHKWLLVLEGTRWTRPGTIKTIYTTYIITNRDSITSTFISLACLVLEIQGYWCFRVTWWLLQFLNGGGFESFRIAFSASMKHICNLEMSHLYLGY
jgi:hypothetical protein